MKWFPVDTNMNCNTCGKYLGDHTWKEVVHCYWKWYKRFLKDLFGLD